jgi:hypothetical protein
LPNDNKAEIKNPDLAEEIETKIKEVLAAEAAPAE